MLGGLGGEFAHECAGAESWLPCLRATGAGFKRGAAHSAAVRMWAVARRAVWLLCLRRVLRGSRLVVAGGEGGHRRRCA